MSEWSFLPIFFFKKKQNVCQGATLAPLHTLFFIKIRASNVFEIIFVALGGSIIWSPLENTSFQLGRIIVLVYTK